jgi:hypothetical protein
MPMDPQHHQKVRAVAQKNQAAPIFHLIVTITQTLALQYHLLATKIEAVTL